MPRTTRHGKNPANFIRLNGDGTATVELTQGKVATIDAGDVGKVNGRLWFAFRDKNRWYAATHYREADPIVFMHRVIADTAVGQKTDHWDGDGLNNRRANLRTCTDSQNFGNQRARNKTGYKGVNGFPRSPGSFQPEIAGRKLPCCSTPEAAARAYDEAAREKYGEFASLNFPRPGERSALTGQILPLPEPSAP